MVGVKWGLVLNNCLAYCAHNMYMYCIMVGLIEMAIDWTFHPCMPCLIYLIINHRNTFLTSLDRTSFIVLICSVCVCVIFTLYIYVCMYYLLCNTYFGGLIIILKNIFPCQPVVYIHITYMGHLNFSHTVSMWEN